MTRPVPARRSTPVELREPSLPATARKVATGMRRGWTTGSCAAAAAKAAGLALKTGERPEQVDIPLPGGKKLKRASFVVESCELHADSARAVVIKDAGDDPDVTHGARMTAEVRRRDEPGIVIRGGEGVGVVTKPGLGLEVGGPAINKVPRAQITAAVAEVFNLDSAGVDVCIEVPGGEKMARKTTNPRLGIIGGISILGTTGIVRPFSTAAWRASVGQAIDVMAAQGQREFVLSTGGRTEKAAIRLAPQFDAVCFIEVGDFTGYALKRAVANDFERCVFVGMAGKLTKLAAGIMMTHWTRSKVDPALLAEITREAGGDAATVAAVSEANTARHAYEIWEQAGLDAACEILCERVAANLRRFVEGTLRIDVVMVDFEGDNVVGASKGALHETAQGLQL